MLIFNQRWHWLHKDITKAPSSCEDPSGIFYVNCMPKMASKRKDEKKNEIDLDHLEYEEVPDVSKVI